VSATPAPLPDHGPKHVPTPQGNQKHLDMNAARAATAAGGTMYDQDADDGVPTGGWSTNDTGFGGSSNGVNAATRPASTSSQIRPGGGVTP
jgi:hypothetical protein